jgi:hypothetical protein
MNALKIATHPKRKLRADKKQPGCLRNIKWRNSKAAINPMVPPSYAGR